MRTALRLGTCLALVVACFAVFGCANAPPVNQSYLMNPSFPFANQGSAYTSADDAEREKAARAEAVAVYEEKCSGCHGVNGAGSTVARPVAGLPVADVTNAITKGKGNMKPIELANSDAVAAYVLDLK